MLEHELSSTLAQKCLESYLFETPGKSFICSIQEGQEGSFFFFLISSPLDALV